MGMLYLNQLAPALGRLTPPYDASRESAIRADVRSILESWALWPNGGSVQHVAWVTNLSQLRVRPEDCIVHFVSNYSSGVVRFVLDAQLAQPGLHPDDRRDILTTRREATDMNNLVHLGNTIPDQTIGFASEVYVGKCLHRMFLRNFHNPAFTPANQHQYAICLAATAFHEVMHNKVEPEMRRRSPGWDQHVRGDGPTRGVASSIHIFQGQVTPANPTNKNLMRQHFNSRHRQYIPGVSAPATPTAPTGPTAAPSAAPAPAH